MLSTHTRQVRVIAAMGAMVVFALLFSAYALRRAAHNAEDQRQDLCHQVEHIKAQIRTTITAAQKELPKIQYYQHHPKDLQVAINANKAVLETFAPVKC